MSKEEILRQCNCTDLPLAHGGVLDVRPHFGNLCMVAATPELIARLRENPDSVEASTVFRAGRARPIGLDDGSIYPPPTEGADGVERTQQLVARASPLRGTLKVVVVLVDFPDQKFAPGHDLNHFQQLFFSSGVLPHGSVAEYYKEVSGGLVSISGSVVGPFHLPRKIKDYAHGASGTGSTSPNAQNMAADALSACNASVDFSTLDNDGDGYVDAFIVVHAGVGAETTGSKDQIWSHKWSVAGGPISADGKKVYMYLTVP